MSALATVAGESFNEKFTAKIDIPLGYFTLPVLMLTFKVSLSMKCLIRIWSTCWCNLNKIVWSKLYKIVNIFAKNG